MREKKCPKSYEEVNKKCTKSLKEVYIKNTRTVHFFVLQKVLLKITQCVQKRNIHVQKEYKSLLLGLKLFLIINRPGLARAVLQIPSSLIISLFN